MVIKEILEVILSGPITVLRKLFLILRNIFSVDNLIRDEAITLRDAVTFLAASMAVIYAILAYWLGIDMGVPAEALMLYALCVCLAQGSLVYAVCNWRSVGDVPIRQVLTAMIASLALGFLTFPIILIGYTSEDGPNGFLFLTFVAYFLHARWIAGLYSWRTIWVLGLSFLAFILVQILILLVVGM